MNNLWVYGCSFSEPFGLLPQSTENTILEDGLRNFLNIDYWGTHLANKLHYNCVSKGLSGIGWNYISYHVDMDTMKWNKDDIIIISPSFFSRVNINEFYKHNGTTTADYVHLLKNVNELILHNETRWQNKIKTLQHFGYNVFTWLVDDGMLPKDDVKNLIKTPEQSHNFKDWMDIHKEYWIDPTTNTYPLGDWHFNTQGHIAVSEVMYKYISSHIGK